MLLAVVARRLQLQRFVLSFIPLSAAFFLHLGRILTMRIVTPLRKPRPTACHHPRLGEVVLVGPVIFALMLSRDTRTH
jgi:hypothetical protein